MGSWRAGYDVERRLTIKADRSRVPLSRPVTFTIDIAIVSAHGNVNISTRTDLQHGGHDMLPDHRPSRSLKLS